jgi:hypothetical protein
LIVLPGKSIIVDLQHSELEDFIRRWTTKGLSCGSARKAKKKSWLSSSGWSSGVSDVSS